MSFIIPAVGADPHLTPATQAVLRGDVAEFTCRTSNTQWTVMTLSLNDKSVLTIYNQTGPLPSPTNNPVTARPLSPELPRKGWVFSLNTTAMQDEAKVTCELQGIGQDTANLSVQGQCARCRGCGGVESDFSSSPTLHAAEKIINQLLMGMFSDSYR